MKNISKIILSGSIAIVVAVLSANGQPVLTAANSNPVAGDVYTVFNAPLPPFSQATAAGAAQTWNFSAYPGTLDDSYTFIDAASTPWIGFFPGATVSLYFPSSNYYNYFMGTATDYSFMGSSAGTGTNVYTNPYKYLSYPLHYQDVFVDTFYNTSGTWTAYSTHTADGYGDVILPGGTVSNVLRTHEYTYIVYPTDTTYENFYSWMKPGVHWNVCQYGEIHTSTQVLNTFFNYLDPVASGIADLNDSKNVSCYPNPFHNNLLVTVKNKNYREVSFTIKNTLNQTVFSNQNNFSSSPLKSIDPGFLPNGIYLLEINIDEERIVKKIVKQ